MFLRTGGELRNCLVTILWQLSQIVAVRCTRWCDDRVSSPAAPRVAAVIGYEEGAEQMSINRRSSGRSDQRTTSAARHLRRAGAWLALLLVAALVVAVTTAGAANKPYSLNVTTNAPTYNSQQGVTGAGQTVSITAAIKDDTTTQHLGSANLFPPSSAFDHMTGAFLIQGVTASIGGTQLAACRGGSSAPCFLPAPGQAAPNCTNGTFTAPCVELRNLSLSPGGEVDATVSVKTPACDVGPLAWQAQVKQANNFSGTPGNDLTLDSPGGVNTTLDGACSLAFVAQPHDALTNTTITDTDWSTSGGPVTVQVMGQDGSALTTSTDPVALDFASNLGGATLTGGGAQPAVSGLATFAGLSIDQAGVYSLAASSGTLTGTSQSFTISDTKTACQGGVACTGSQSDTNGNGTTVTSNDGTGGASYFLLISTNVNDTQLSCAGAQYGGYKTADPNTYDTFTTVGASKVVSIRINTPIGVSGNANKVLRAQQICFGATTDFPTASGAMAAAGTLPDGTAGFIGLLPDCSSSSTGPCHNRQQDKTIPDPKRHIGYDIVLVFDIPANFAGDPFHC